MTLTEQKWTETLFRHQTQETWQVPKCMALTITIAERQLLLSGARAITQQFWEESHCLHLERGVCASSLIVPQMFRKICLQFDKSRNCLTQSYKSFITRINFFTPRSDYILRGVMNNVK